jgi:WD40 repeat protein
LASIGPDNILVWDIPSTKVIATLREKGGISMLAFTADGKSLVSGYVNGTICFWDPQTGKKNATWTGNNKSVRCVACSPDGKIIATAGADAGDQNGVIDIWDVADQP